MLPPTDIDARFKAPYHCRYMFLRLQANTDTENAKKCAMFGHDYETPIWEAVALDVTEMGLLDKLDAAENI